MESQFTFHTLDNVDSTNNYAMGLLREGLAEHGTCWFAQNQTSGRGQLGKQWISEPGANITMSVVVKPESHFQQEPFIFNMLIALICRKFLEGLVSEKFNIKWPNDIFVNDRKAGGLLIENSFRGKDWMGSVVGIGLNVNQVNFEGVDNAPISLKMISGDDFDTVELAKALHKEILVGIIDRDMHKEYIVAEYNKHLYKVGETIDLILNGQMIRTKITGVNSQGLLETESGSFRSGGIAINC